MITTRGQRQILSYIGGRESQIASSLEVGIGLDPVTASDEALSFPAYAVDVEIVGVDVDAGTVVFKSTLPEDAAGVFTEVGLSSSSLNANAGKYPSVILASGNQSSELWTGGTFTNQNVRLDSTGVRVSPNNGSQKAVMETFDRDLAGYSSLDTFKMLVHRSGSINNFRLRMRVDEYNYFMFDSQPVLGENTIVFSKSDFAVFGEPSWDELVYMDIEAYSNTTGSVTFDALRIDDRDSVNSENFLVGRKLVEPFTKVPGVPLEIEFGIQVGFA